MIDISDYQTLSMHINSSTIDKNVDIPTVVIPAK
jgi:hypothetical protein